MEEPLCTFKLYETFKCICEELPKTKAPYDGIVRSVQELIMQYDPVYRDTWRFVLSFLSLIAEVNTKLSARTISTVFSDILFKPQEYRSTDMVIWKNFTDLLTIMITEQNRIFEPVDSLKQSEFEKRQQDQSARLTASRMKDEESKRTVSDYQDALDHIEPDFDGTPEVESYKTPNDELPPGSGPQG